MGVTYKLKQEVIDFIVNEKRQDQSLSCRKLAMVVKKRFSLDVSKSSINAIVKDCALSNPIGRRPKVQPPKNFYIPKEKKSALRAEVAPFLPAALVIKPSQAETPSQKEEAVSEPQPSAQVKELEVIDADNALPLMADPLSEIQAVEQAAVDATLLSEQKKSQRRERAQKIWDGSEEIFSSAGSLLFTSFLWQMSRQPVLGNVIARECGIESSLGLDSALEALCVAEDLDVLAAEDVSSAEIRMLAGVYDVSPTALAKNYALILGKQLEGPRAAFAMQAELAAMFKEVAVIEFVLSSGGRFYADPHTFAASETVPGPTAPGAFLLEVTERLADTFVTNITPYVFLIPPGASALQEKTAALWQKIAGTTDDPVDQINVILQDGETIVLFERLPRIRRSYTALGVLSEKEQAQAEFEKLGAEEEFFDPIADKTLVYTEGRLCRQSGDKLRLLSVKERLSGTRIAILTNISGNLSSNESLLGCSVFQTADLLNNWLKNERSASLNRINTAKVGNFTSLLDILKQVRSMMFSRISQTLPGEFPADIFPAIASVPGCVKRHSSGIAVRLIPAQDFPYKIALQSFINYLNGRFTKNHAGTRIFFTSSH